MFLCEIIKLYFKGKLLFISLPIRPSAHCFTFKHGYYFVGNIKILTSNVGGARMEFKSQQQIVPPRLRRKSEGERRDRKPRERGLGKSGSGSGGEVDENWETTSETSEHEDNREPGDKEDDRRNDRRNFSGPSRGYPRRQPPPNR